MAQTTAHATARNAKVEISSDGSSWTDISGIAQSVSPGDGTRLTGTAFTFDGNGPIISAGKLDAQESTLKITYTEDGTGYEALRTQFETANSTAYLRVTPKGATTGNYRFTSGIGVMTKFPYFGDLDAGSGDVMTVEMTVMHGGWAKATVP